MSADIDKLGISDDDLCSSCKYLRYRPGELSSCDLGFPAEFDEDGYSVECDHYEQIENQEDNWDVQ